MSRDRRPSGGAWFVGLAIAGLAALVVRGVAASGPSASPPIERPGATTTPLAGAAGAGPERDLERILRAVSGADHRWFFGLLRRGIGGYVIGHQGPEMSADQFSVVSNLGAPLQVLTAFGSRAWVIAAPLAPGGESPVFAIRLARNEIYDTWFPAGRAILNPKPRFPAGVRPLVAAASPAGPVLVAEPGVPGGPFRLLRLGVDQWVERELGDPAGVRSGVLAAERPLALAVVRVPSGPELAEDEVENAGEDPGSAAAPEETDEPPVGTSTVTVLLLAGRDELAVDYIAATGERWRAWSGLPDVAAAIRSGDGLGGVALAEPADAADPDAPVQAAVVDRPFRATIFEVDRHVWIAYRSFDELVIEPFILMPPVDEGGVPDAAAAAAVGPLTLGGDPSAVIRVRLEDGPITVIGGDGPMLLEGDALEDPDAPTRARAWTSAGVEDLDGPLSADEVDPSVLLRGPIIMGTGVFFAVIAAVLTSRLGPRPPAIEGREAPVGRRISAALIDAIAPLVAAMLVFNWTPDAMIASLLLLHPGGYAVWISVTLLWAFATIVGDLAGGRTPGRLVMRVRPVDADGGRPSGGRLVLRFAVRLISVAYPPLILFWLASARGRGLHDLAARTWVIRTDVPAPPAAAPPESSSDSDAGRV